MCLFRRFFTVIDQSFGQVWPDGLWLSHMAPRAYCSEMTCSFFLYVIQASVTCHSFIKLITLTLLICLEPIGAIFIFEVKTVCH